MTQFTLIDPKLAKEIPALIGTQGIAFNALCQITHTPGQPYVTGALLPASERKTTEFTAIVAIRDDLLVSIRVIKKTMFGTKSDNNFVFGIKKEKILGGAFNPERPDAYVITLNTNEKFAFIVTPENKPAVDEMIKALGLAQ